MVASLPRAGNTVMTPRWVVDDVDELEHLGLQRGTLGEVRWLCRLLSLSSLLVVVVEMVVAVTGCGDVWSGRSLESGEQESRVDISNM